MIRAGSLDCYLPVDHHVLDSLEALVDYLSRMTQMIVNFLALLMLMMLMHLIPWPGT